ncbi:chorismate-binding protein [Cesiribacter andamanensis]|uniref:isochorismate synthase n=1 Tax=Cesiribacter andamanensis AMV16 TaxID=1279009 RepID=M7NWU9_9BACT|nr:chorismate-binding protein [Cesiribacter andamanensis]EMR02934.1 Isochorismate synthase entC [Cesiribacter andamanensis AMV16]
MSDTYDYKTGEALQQPIPSGQLFAAALQLAAARGYSFAAWRLPAQQQPSLLIDLSGSAAKVHPSLEELPTGFLFAPYQADLTALDAREKPGCLFLRADLLWEGQQGELRPAEGLPPQRRAQAESFLEELEQEEAPAASAYPLAPCRAGTTPKTQYIHLVEQSVAAIRRGDFQKNVCARTKEVALPAGFSLSSFFLHLSAAYPNAFVSLVAIPGVGTWIGATPEILISVDRHQKFCTVALAGTQRRQAGMRPVDAVWRQKEIEEQAMVSRYIINCLKKVRIREFEEIGPRTIAAANLLHLRTDFTIDLKEVHYPNLPTVMLELLHPTSAVCGLPKEPAAAFLETHEQLDRSFFAGFLGPVHLQQETHLFVNLRCMQLLERTALLYAGAGITADSDAEREWQETEHKCQTLLDVLYEASR